MLIEFSVKNYLSFKDMKTINMTTVPSLSKKELPENIIKHGKLSLIKSAVIYGGNGSGKTNFLKAISFFKKIVLNSAKDSIDFEKLSLNRFRFNSACTDEPTYFEAVFIQPVKKNAKKIKVYKIAQEIKISTDSILAFLEKELKIDISFKIMTSIDEFAYLEVLKNFDKTAYDKKIILLQNEKAIPDDIIFRYGFTFDRDKICSEWLFARFSSVESLLFGRDGDSIKFGEKFKEGKQIYSQIGNFSKQVLFLSLINLVKGENAELTNTVINWFKNIKDITSIIDNQALHVTHNLSEQNSMLGNQVLNSLKLADINIDGVLKKEEPLAYDNLPSRLRTILSDKEKSDGQFMSINFFTLHKKYNEKYEVIDNNTPLNFEQEESEGTKKFYSLIGPALKALEDGSLLLIDELEAKLHPNLCKIIVILFNSAEINTNNAQLIFTTHNILLLNNKTFRRDQIYFADKNKYGESDLYALSDYDKVRTDSSYDKDYLLGKYGAIPYLGDFRTIFSKDE